MAVLNPSTKARTFAGRIAYDILFTYMRYMYGCADEFHAKETPC